MSAGLCGLRLLPRMPVMERIGASSYVIYLYHPLFVAAVFAGLGVLPALPTTLLFAVAAAAGLAGPIVMELVAARSSARQAPARGPGRQSPPPAPTDGEGRAATLRVA